MMLADCAPLKRTWECNNRLYEGKEESCKKRKKEELKA
jgi:hypothetical protein